MKRGGISFTAITTLLFGMAMLFSQCGCGVTKNGVSSVLQKDSLRIEDLDKSMAEFEAVYASGFTPVTKSERVSSSANVRKVKNALKGKKQVVQNGRSTTDGQQLLTQSDFSKENVVYVIKKNFDLKGGRVVLPAGCALSFEGGSLNNGVIVGDKTVIVYDGTIFNGINIEGTWNVPEIKTTMFADAEKVVNRLTDVIALTSPEVDNTVYVENGDYTLEVSTYGKHILPVNSNTTIILEGTLSLLGTEYPRYRIFSIRDAENITIRGNGKGKIVGDKDLHTYTPEVPDPESKRGLNSTHEYGHGIEITNSNNIDISGITITKCIGDGICIYGTDVSCSDIVVTYCRRQGISVGKGQRISISSCKISNIFGSRKAGFGVDIEPDDGNAVSDVIVNNCDITFCNGGIGCMGHKLGDVRNVLFYNCHLSTFGLDIHPNSMQHRAVVSARAVNCEIRSCVFEEFKNRMVVFIEEADNFRFVNNQLTSHGSQFGLVLRGMRGFIYVKKNRISMYERDSDRSYGVALTNLHNAIVMDNEINADNLSFSADTDCKNVIMKGNTIEAKWEPGREISVCKVENNIFKKSVSLGPVKDLTLKNNQMYSLKVKSREKSEIVSNKTER